MPVTSRMVLTCFATVLLALASASACAAAHTVPTFMEVVSATPIAFETASTGEGALAPVSFGRVEPGRPLRRSVEVTSSRGGVIDQIGVGAGQYFAVLDPNGCENRTLGPGGSCTVTVVVSVPNGAAASIEDRLLVSIGGTTHEQRVAATT